MTLKYISRSFSLGCHFHVHFSYPWHAFASHGLPAIAEVLVEHPIATPLSTTYWRSEAAKSARVRPGRRDIISGDRALSQADGTLLRGAGVSRSSLSARHRTMSVTSFVISRPSVASWTVTSCCRLAFWSINCRTNSHSQSRALRFCIGL